MLGVREIKSPWSSISGFLRLSILSELERRHGEESRIMYKRNKRNLMHHICTSLILLNCSEFGLN